MPDQRTIPRSDLIRWLDGYSWPATTYVTDSKIDVVTNVEARFDNGPLHPWWEAKYEPGFDLVPLNYRKSVEETPTGARPLFAGIPVEQRIVRWQFNGDRGMHGSAMSQERREREKAFMDDGSIQSVLDAEKKAEELLLSMLNPQQRLDYFATKGHLFFVYGKINPLYRVSWYNGLEVVCPIKMKRVHRNGHVSKRWLLNTEQTICFHPDTWLPAQDTMLATKLMIENDEATLLRTANVTKARTPRVWGIRRGSTRLGHLWIDKDGKLMNDLRKRKPEPGFLFR